VAIDLIGEIEALPSASLENTRERWSTLMSLWESAISTIECQIQRSCDATAYGYASFQFHIAFVLPMPSKCAVLPFSVHAIYASKHTRKSSWLNDWQKSGSVNNI
jgi:hypothetical protein